MIQRTGGGDSAWITSQTADLSTGGIGAAGIDIEIVIWLSGGSDRVS